MDGRLIALPHHKPKGEIKSMERYFIVTEENRLHKDWFDYKENSTRVCEIFKDFKQTVGIEAHGYYVSDDSIYIVPTENDLQAFKSILGAPNNEGLRKFRASSKISKAWVQMLKDAGLKVLRKPMVLLYFRSFGGRYRSRLFDKNGVVYCSIDPAGDETPKGFIEMKASEFYKIIEDAELATA
ncbi:hypothetical protein D3C76_1114440 [compost metagenome]